MRKQIAALALEGVAYRFANGLRHVMPYDYVYATHAKERWYGRTVLDVFAREFGDRTPAYYAAALRDGRITLSGERVDAARVLKSGDRVEHAVRRTEPPVDGSAVRVVAETAEYVAVDKPATIPVHPCGGYRCNSLLYILAHDHGLATLRPLHRLDRLTSGLVLFAKSAEFAATFAAAIRTRDVAKTYYARVAGEFPACAAEDVARRALGAKGGGTRSPTRAPPPSFSASRWSSADDDAAADDDAGEARGAIETLEFDCPLGVTSHKEGAHAALAEGKPSTTRFKRLAVLTTAEGQRESIVECSPLTGRTHQIRLHLLALGFPIANDPNYNFDCAPARVAHVALTAGRVALRDSRGAGGGDDAPSDAPHRLHCAGIYLHAKRYVGAGINAETPDPPWSVPPAGAQ
jgi:23S rRNA-/tRNA-specific pseudouridylate synthase